MKILIVGSFLFPFGSASANRIRLLADGLVANGAKVWALPLHPPLDDPRFSELRMYGEIPYQYINKPRPAKYPLFERLGREIREQNVHTRTTKEFIAAHDIDIVLASSHDGLRLASILRAARESGVPIVNDLVEWFSAFHFRGGWLHPRGISHEWCLRRVCWKLDAVCGISSYLCRYYERGGMPTIRVPGLIGPDEGPQRPLEARSAGPLRLGYFGTWSRKDGIFGMFESIERVLERGVEVELRISGRPKNARIGRRIEKYLQSHRAVKEAVRFLGFIPDERMGEEFSACDALILFQEDLRYSRARFPQKIAEYMSFGRPVIVSGAGDIPEYVRDERDGYVVEPGDAEKFADAILKLNALPDRGVKMGLSARERTFDVFDANRHAGRLLKFFEELKAKESPTRESPKA